MTSPRCPTGKQVYDRERDAKAAARLMHVRGRRRAKRQAPYPCRFCGGYHLATVRPVPYNRHHKPRRTRPRAS